MPDEGGTPQEKTENLLQPDEPLPFKVLNPDSTRPILLLCDHASRRFPKVVGDLGLDPVAQRCHLAWDIGAGALTERLASELGATAVMAEYSRLVVDCNRHLMDPSAFLEFGDGVVVHGNRGLPQSQKDLRAKEIYWPYHYAIDIELRRLSSVDFPPAVFAIHSFTPVLDGISRECQIGVLWDADRPTAEIVIDGFRAAGYLVGDNEPYSGKAPMDFTIDQHAESAGGPHVGIEIRQDLIDGDEGVATIAPILRDIIERVPAGSAYRLADEEQSVPA